MAARSKQLLLLCTLGALLCAGGVLLWRAGLGIPCLFHLVTGLDCPGCGVTRMLAALAAGDLAGAWRSNPCLLALSPVLAVLAFSLAAGWLRTGQLHPKRLQSLLLWGCIGVLLVFGVLRNLPFYPY